MRADFYAFCLTCQQVCQMEVDGFGEEQWWPVSADDLATIGPEEYADSTVSKCAACVESED